MKTIEGFGTHDQHTQIETAVKALMKRSRRGTTKVKNRDDSPPTVTITETRTASGSDGRRLIASSHMSRYAFPHPNSGSIEGRWSPESHEFRRGQNGNDVVISFGLLAGKVAMTGVESQLRDYGFLERPPIEVLLGELQTMQQERR